jgi:signal transduction histidine kinase
VRIATRLWIFGALVPVAALVGALLVAGQVFRVRLERQLDEALLSQAAVEAVSLFDAPGSGPHLHMEENALSEKVRGFAPEGTVYGPDGRVAVRYPPRPWVPEALVFPGNPGPPELFDRDTPHAGRQRVVRATVLGLAQVRYVVELAASTDGVEAAVSAFRRISLAVALTLGAFLLAVQTWQARRLTARVRALTDHMAALREGDLAARPAPDAGRDEIADLREVVAEATGRLEEARHAQERLIAEAAHELRTPLGLMRTELDLALRRRRAPEELREALEDVRNEVDRLASLSSRLLDLAAVGRGTWDRSPGDLAEVVREAVEAARADAEVRGVLVHFDPPGPMTAIFHAGGIRQAVDNLLSNAVRFSPRGGEVQVTLDARDGHCRVAVRDEGPGIPVAERERVFEPFHRVEEGAAAGPPGAGLGLSIVREIARHHGGSAWVEPPAGAGAEVVLEIPREAHAGGRRRSHAKAP